MPKIITNKRNYEITGELMVLLNDVMQSFDDYVKNREDFNKEKFLVRLTALYTEFYPTTNRETWKMIGNL